MSTAAMALGMYQKVAANVKIQRSCRKKLKNRGCPPEANSTPGGQAPLQRNHFRRGGGDAVQSPHPPGAQAVEQAQLQGVGGVEPQHAPATRQAL